MSAKNNFLSIAIFFSSLMVAVCLPTDRIFAEDLEQTCAQVSNSSSICQNMTGQDCRVLLEKCAKFYEDESNKIAGDLTKTAGEKKTLQSQITTLRKKVQSLEYQINQGNVVIKDLALQIGETKTSISKITLQIQESQYQISSILRSIAEEDQKSSVEVLLEGNLSDFFGNIVRLESLNSELRSLLENTKDLKIYLEGQKVKMDDEKSQTEKTVKLQSLQKVESANNKKQQEGLLKLTEAQYQEQLQQQQDVKKKAAAIRARIFEMVGVSKAPTFGEAYAIAKYVSGVTGVRPAFLLAILTQESNLGKNVGQCVLTNTSTGAGKRISNGASLSRVMSPKSITYFLNITKDLGRDYSIVPVSCPLSYGYGGGMGPGQFIPSTWIIYSPRIRQITGKAPDPWDIRDAFLASGLYLGDSGAKKQTYNGEWSAAMIYYSGSTSTKYRFYGDSVMRIAAGYADDIAAIESQ